MAERREIIYFPSNTRIGKVKLQTKWPGRFIKNKENSRKSEVNDKQQNTTLSEQF